MVDGLLVIAAASGLKRRLRKTGPSRCTIHRKSEVQVQVQRSVLYIHGVADIYTYAQKMALQGCPLRPRAPDLSEFEYVLGHDMVGKILSSSVLGKACPEPA